ncbi:MAG: MmcQ/YjbR family DNA-binding protein [Rubrivivax sp.]|jgi:hypothetical protein
MAMMLQAVRDAALALPETTEEPHHHFGSFRVRGTIFVTVPPDQEHVNLFLSDDHREQALALYPSFTEKLMWGGKVVGLKVALPDAEPSAVLAMISQSYQHRAAKRPAGPRRPASASEPTP